MISLPSRLISFAAPLALVLALAVAANVRAADARLANLSTRAWVGRGGEAVISGFSIGAGAPKSVLIRAVGPALGTFGLSGTLDDPVLAVFDSSGREIARNDDWSAANAASFLAVGAFAVPANSRDAALVLSNLPPGNYTARVSGVADTTGIALLEIYDLDTDPSASRLANLSTRAQVGTGAAVMMPGLVVSPGPRSSRLLIRAAGPALSALGVDGALVDPVLAVLDARGAVVARNDNWSTPVTAASADPAALAAAFGQAGAFTFAAQSKDAAVLVELAPGSYTIQVSGAAGATGVALVEVYELARESAPAAPLVLDAPVAESVVSGGAVTVGAIAPDPAEIARVQFRLNNTIPIGEDTTRAPYRSTFDTTALENGVYQLTVIAHDAAGRTTISAPVRITVNNPSTAGAVLAWTGYEAEDAARHPQATVQSAGTWGQPGREAAFEARGKRCVVLSDGGQFVEWPHAVAANRVTVRYALPAETSTATLGLYINGQRRAGLALTGARTRESKPVANVPGGIVRFWDELVTAVEVPNDATIRLESETPGVACQIDFIELETAPPPLSVPDDTWVVADGFDRAAIVSAISAASVGSRKVWLPPGTYTVSSQISLPAGLELRGAGIWHTTIVKGWGGANARMFRVAGANTLVRDLKAVDTITTLTGNSSNCIFDVIGSTRCELRNIWTEYATLAIAYASDSLAVRDCRVRNGYKDAIHIATTSQGGLIENCTFRNTGDDCAAFVIYEATGPGALRNNTARRNTMEGTYWGRSISFQGGDNNRAEYNLVRDGSMAGIMIAIDTWTTSVWSHNTNFDVRRNVIVRCGNQTSASAGAAIAFYSPPDVFRPMSGRVEENTVLEPPFHGVRFNGNIGDAGHLVTFQGNGIAAPTTSGGPPWERKQISLRPGSQCIHEPNIDL